MWRLLVMCALCGTTLAQTSPETTETPPTTSPQPPTPAIPLPPTPSAPPDANASTIKPPIGADHQPMEGGSEFDKPFPQAVPIKQGGTLSGGEPAYPCFGTFTGNDSRTKRHLLTSVFCNVEGHIDKEFSPFHYQDIPLKKLIGPIRKKRQAVVTITHPFTVVTYQFSHARRLNETAFNAPGELITDVAEYRKVIGNPQSKGIVLASRPYKAGAVSLDQRNCSDSVYKVRKDPDKMPENLTEGVFCVFMGKEHIEVNGTDIAPGLPCRDSLGSPVLVEGPSGYTRVLGIIITQLCQYLPEDFGNIPKCALAASTAYSFNYTRLPTRPPGYYNITWPTFPSPPPIRLDDAPTQPRPRGESPSLSFSKALFLQVMVMCFVRTCELHYP